ncbi:hypothetical protein E2562_000182 [Oryza meyeriana var. granulata]|uniref:Uncharacterized protein n=1 Tax=Oryza meyeriana var. granulata TaxID=110450 RepID=A0A6G1DBR2_9ORYZ|nr:hypothetical protein E2562_000182 [Oryza meyeriana var. granulata]
MAILEPQLQSYIGGTNVIDNIIHKIRRAVRFIGSHTVVKARFRDYCRAQNKPGRMFVVDVKHRWNTTYLMPHQVKGYEQ